MRIAGIFYVVAIITLNFFIEEEWFFILALTAYPVALILLLQKGKLKKPISHQTHKEVENVDHKL
jgi:hypothetical protein